jgi:hypothetical protein
MVAYLGARRWGYECSEKPCWAEWLTRECPFFYAWGRLVGGRVMPFVEDGSTTVIGDEEMDSGRSDSACETEKKT